MEVAENVHIRALFRKRCGSPLVRGADRCHASLGDRQRGPQLTATKTKTAKRKRRASQSFVVVNQLASVPSRRPCLLPCHRPCLSQPICCHLHLRSQSPTSVSVHACLCVRVYVPAVSVHACLCACVCACVRVCMRVQGGGARIHFCALGRAACQVCAFRHQRRTAAAPTPSTPSPSRGHAALTSILKH